MILHLYFARRFLKAFLGVFAAFAAIAFLFDLVDQMRRIDGTGLSLASLVRLTLLHVPDSLYGFLPLVTILATLTLFLSLARSSELAVTRAAGRSALRSLAGPLAVALLIGILGVLVFNPIVASTTKQYDNALARLTESGGAALSVSTEGLFLRQGDGERQTVIRAARASLDGTTLHDVTFLTFSPDRGPAERVRAPTAQLAQGTWILEDAKRWDLTSTNPERDSEVADRLEMPTSLTRDQILDSFGQPSSIPIWDLPSFIDGLEQAGFSARQHKVWFQMELSSPLLLMAMVLIGASFTMRDTRSGRIGVMVLMALGLGFALYFIRNFAQILAENGQIPILLAAWGPPVAALLLPMGPLLHWEDG